MFGEAVAFRFLAVLFATILGLSDRAMLIYIAVTLSFEENARPLCLGRL